jgi:hypothetical protein
MTDGTNRISIPIERYRTDPTISSWDLPPWGHPLSQGVLPLFFNVKGRLIPIGTAFTVGSGVAFIVSAMHNVLEVFNHELRLQHLVTAQTLPQAIDIREVEIYVLHHRWRDESETDVDITLWPVEYFSGAPPTDVVFGFPQFNVEFPTLVLPLSFATPTPGMRIWSIGYADFRVPNGGIELERVKDGTFNWRSDYAHRFIVVEGRVDRIFVRRFSQGFVNGPCFTFDAEVPHGLSGGPILDTGGIVRGVTSAGASLYFSKPMTIASFLQPLLFQNIRVGMQMGPVRINVIHPMIHWIATGIIRTDGSEKEVPVSDAGGKYNAGLLVPTAYKGFVHEDLQGYVDGVAPAPDLPEALRIKHDAGK